MKDSTWTTIDARSGDYTGIRMTPAQSRTLATFLSRLPDFDFYGSPDRYEIKKLELSQAEPDPELTALLVSVGMRPKHPSVFVSVVTGMVDDEGTLAEVYCRKYRHLCIGPRGGLQSSLVTDTGFRPVSIFQALNSEYWGH